MLLFSSFGLAFWKMLFATCSVQCVLALVIDLAIFITSRCVAEFQYHLLIHSFSIILNIQGFFLSGFDSTTAYFDHVQDPFSAHVTNSTLFIHTNSFPFALFCFLFIALRRIILWKLRETEKEKKRKKTRDFKRFKINECELLCNGMVFQINIRNCQR